MFGKMLYTLSKEQNPQEDETAFAPALALPTILSLGMGNLFMWISIPLAKLDS